MTFSHTLSREIHRPSSDGNHHLLVQAGSRSGRSVKVPLVSLICRRDLFLGVVRLCTYSLIFHGNAQWCHSIISTPHEPGLEKFSGFESSSDWCMWKRQVFFEESSAVRKVILNRPTKLNPVNYEMVTVVSFFLTRQLVCTRKLITRFVLSLEQASKILRNVEKYECDPTVGCVILKVRNEIKLQVQ